MCSCNKKSKQPVNPTTSTSVASYTSEPFASNPDFLKVTYAGPNYSHNILSPTNILWNEYKMKRYAYGRNGLVLYVHKNDVVARPDLFVVIQETPKKKVSKETLNGSL